MLINRFRPHFLEAARSICFLVPVHFSKSDPRFTPQCFKTFRDFCEARGPWAGGGGGWSLSSPYHILLCIIPSLPRKTSLNLTGFRVGDEDILVWKASTEYFRSRPSLLMKRGRVEQAGQRPALLRVSYSRVSTKNNRQSNLALLSSAECSLHWCVSHKGVTLTYCLHGSGVW